MMQVQQCRKMWPNRQYPTTNHRKPEDLQGHSNYGFIGILGLPRETEKGFLGTLGNPKGVPKIGS